MTDGYAVLIGSAFEIGPDYPRVSPYLRLYDQAGHTYVGYSTEDELYFCSDECVHEYFKNWTVTTTPGAYLTPSDDPDEVLTADVRSNDWPETVHCEVCKGVIS